MTSCASRTAGLFVPKPSCGPAYQRRSARGLRQTVRGCPLTSAVGRGDCHSLRHPVAVRTRTSVSLARSVYVLRRGLESSTAVAKALPATDSDCAARLIADAERIARSITDQHRRSFVPLPVAEALAVTDPDGAERIAHSPTDEDWKSYALAEIAKAMSTTALECRLPGLAQHSHQAQKLCLPVGSLYVCIGLERS